LAESQVTIGITKAGGVTLVTQDRDKSCDVMLDSGNMRIRRIIQSYSLFCDSVSMSNLDMDVTSLFATVHCPMRIFPLSSMTSHDLSRSCVTRVTPPAFVIPIVTWLSANVMVWESGARAAEEERGHVRRGRGT
jgi:hypothetical protein